jgi:hypothetical protein
MTTGIILTNIIIYSANDRKAIKYEEENEEHIENIPEERKKLIKQYAKDLWTHIQHLDQRRRIV